MAVVQMQKIDIIAMKKDRKHVLELLQSRGTVHITDPGEDTSGFKTTSTTSSRLHYERRVANTDEALKILQEYVPEDKSLFDSLKGKDDTERRTYDEIVKKRHWYNTMVASIIEHGRQITGLENDIARYNVSIEGLAPWLDMDIPINSTGTKSSETFIGSMAPDLKESDIKALIDKRDPSLKDKYEIFVVSSDKTQTCICGVCHRNDSEAFNNALRSEGFVRISFFSHRTPEGKVEKYKKDITRCKEDIEKIKAKLKKYAEKRGEFKILSDYYRIRASKYKVLGSLLQSDSTFLITGAVPAKTAPELVSELEKRFELYVELSDYGKDEEAPVLLKNRYPLSSGEGILESYGLPSKGEIDPTGPMCICYIILFGLMLSDAAYGFIVSLVCFILLLKFRKMADSMRKSLTLFMYCGLSTLFWGVMFGGFFGDLISVVSRTFFGHQVDFKPLWFAPLDDPMKMLVVSLVIGIVHLYLGVIMKAVQYAKNRDIVGIISDCVSWLMLITGLIMMLMPTPIFASVTGITIEFSDTMVTVSRVVAIVGAVIILFMAGRKNKNPGARLALGLYDLYNVTSWLSDILSYSRLLALGLATGVIAQVINQMGSMKGKSVGGIILFIVVFIIGHLFNLAINLLGAYVHTCRLQYVEFFGKFYEGGGKKYVPFAEKTKYVNISKIKQNDDKEDLVS